MGTKALALLRQFNAACTSADDLEATTTAFATHQDAEIVTSFPGLGALTGARVLAELGDDDTRFTSPRTLKAYAGSAPITDPPAARPPSWPGTSRTSASPQPATSGPSQPSPHPPEHEPTTTAAAKPKTDTSQPNVTSSTGSWAACTTASPTASPTTSRRLPQHRLTDQPHRMSVFGPLRRTAPTRAHNEYDGGIR
ncbi:transposase [Streptomyces sp. NPDC008150]|uniref:transposase n=1 Tax=Streptomyces sp. NPDC008150 TaxID=3364816 RepID=UPI0036EE892B